jgi:acyl dehydratase
LEKIFLGDAQVGDEVEMHYQMTPELVEQYMRATDDRNPWYTGPSPFGGPVAPPVLVCMRHSDMLSEKYDKRGRLLIGTNATYSGPIMVGTNIIAKGRIVAKYMKRGREYLDMEAESRDENGRLLIKDRRMYMPRYAKKEEDQR